jgi:hypothetical protein
MIEASSSITLVKKPDVIKLHFDEEDYNLDSCSDTPSCSPIKLGKLYFTFKNENKELEENKRKKSIKKERKKKIPISSYKS